MMRQAFVDVLGPATGNEVKIDTVDSFQGKEMHVIIFSCVRASQTAAAGASNRSVLGAFASPRLLLSVHVLLSVCSSGATASVHVLLSVRLQSKGALSRTPVCVCALVCACALDCSCARDCGCAAGRTQSTTPFGWQHALLLQESLAH